MMETREPSVIGEDIQCYQHFLRDGILQVEGSMPVGLGVIGAIEMGARAWSFPSDVSYEEGAIFLLVELDSRGEMTGRELTILMLGGLDLNSDLLSSETPLHLFVPINVSAFDLAQKQ